jgi:NADPH:quinone reductase-like Zn-dependent oxidoreductase
MKAIVQDAYGSAAVLQFRDIDQPVAGDGEALVRVHAASVNPYDVHQVAGRPYLVRLVGRSLGFGLRGPICAVRGFDVAGTVAAVGAGVTRVRPGDEVYGWCDGAFAEYASADANNFVAKPAGLTFEQSAAVPMAGLTALHAVRDVGRVAAGQRVLVNGASGGVGTFAVQIARAFGAEVTGVCSSRNVDLVRSIGAEHVIDYTREDFTSGPRRFDVMIDTAARRSLSDCRRVLTPRGTYVYVGDSGGHWGGGIGRTLRLVASAPFVSQRLRNFLTSPKREDLMVLNELVDAGKVTPVIDRSYGLSETADAIGYMAEGHARGKVVVTV